MPQYKPLAPVEPPITTSPFHRKTPIQHFRGGEGLHPIRTNGAYHPTYPTDGDRHSQIPAQGPTPGWDGSAHPLAHSNPLGSEDGHYRASEQQRYYPEDAPRRMSRPSISPYQGETMQGHAHYHAHQSQAMQGPWYPPTQHAPPAHSFSHGSPAPPTPQPPPRRQGSIPSAPGYESSPATSTGRSLPSSHHTWSPSHTSPPITVPVSIPASTSCAATRTSHPPPFTYILTMRQQPLAARACGQGERDRRTVDPPPILELKITDTETGAPVQDTNALLALTCTLIRVKPNGEEETDAPNKTDRTPARKLMGTTVASPYQGKDEHGRAGTFFVMSDLSCRDPGRHRLRFTLARIDPMMMMQGTRHPSVASLDSEVFTVFVAKDFPGMRASGALLKTLRAQGLNVPLKKGKEARVGGGRGGEGDDDDDDDDEDEEEEEEQEQMYVDSKGEEVGESDGGRVRGRKVGRRKKRKRRVGDG